ncbi:hypothetical protein D5086_012924 [Populus alba]|uniref:Uncharacterized protein n=1 Tax=Populus alba TaxID=43335 RepID=A0ACC4C4A1_POPAL
MNFTVSIEIMHGRFDVHGYFQRHQVINEHKHVLISVILSFHFGKAFLVFLKVIKRENMLDKIWLESARDFTIFKLVNRMKLGIMNVEEESNFGLVKIRARVREVDVCDVELKLIG